MQVSHSDILATTAMNRVFAATKGKKLSFTFALHWRELMLNYRRIVGTKRNEQMKSLAKTVVAIASLFTFVHTAAFGQTAPVDANGVKVIYVDDGTKITKLFKGDAKNLIKTLIIKGNATFLYKDKASDFFKVLSKLPNLENIDASACSGVSDELVTDYSDVRLERLKTLAVGGDYRCAGMSSGFQCSMNDYIEACSHFMSYSNFDGNKRPWTLHRRMYPSLVEYKVANLPSIAEKNLPDSLYLNLDCTNGFIPVILPREKAICFKKVENPISIKYNVIVGFTGYLGHWNPRYYEKIKEKEYIMPANKDLDGVVYTDNGFIRFAETNNITIPNSVRYIVYNEEASSPSRTIESLVFEESSGPIQIKSDAFYELKCKKVVFNRPANLEGGFQDLDSLIFNKKVNLAPQDKYGSGHGLSKIKNLIFNDDAVIKTGCGGSEHENVLFRANATLDEGAFRKVGTLRFEVEPKLKKNYAIAKAVYVPAGFKSKTPEARDYYYGSSIVYEIMPERDVLISKTIEIAKPGTLLSVISPTELNDVDSLTIVGCMYDTDADVLTKLANRVAYLNLRDCIITDSKDDSGVKTCVIPGGFMQNSSTLEEVILPRTAIGIDNHKAFADCPNLRKVTFPPYLEYIWDGAFMNCTSLEEINLPQTVRILGTGHYAGEDWTCFNGCTNLTKVIFNGSKLNYNSFLCGAATASLKEVHLPAYKTWSGGYSHAIGCSTRNPLKNATVYIPEELKSFTGEYVNCEMYFQSPKATILPNSYLKLTNCVIHCPKGATTSYFSAYGEGHQYVESAYPLPKIEKDEYALRYIKNQKQLKERLEETKARKADAEWRRRYGNNAEPCMQCYGTGIRNNRIGNTYYPRVCPYCNGKGVVKRK